ncbi:MAG: glycosyltransferase family 1 protein [Chloroflexota bacterium]|nr:MAG: glycosyltransferase family 1 protein [Chloroflexota bacterium]
MKPPRVAHVVATFPPYWGGTGNVAYYNARSLAARGLDVTVITAAAPVGYVDGEDFPVHRLPTRARLGNAPLLPGLIAAVRDYDLIHLHWPFIFGAELVWLGCKMAGIPYVVTYHHDLRADIRWQFGPYQAAIGPLVLRGARRVLPVSLDHFAASPMRRHVPSARLGEIPNGVDTRFFRPDIHGAAIRQRHGIPSDAFVIGYLGAMDRAHSFKGVPDLIDATAQVIERRAWFLAVGEGDLRASYEARAADRGLAPRSTWTGKAPADELAQHIAAMDCLVLPSRGHGAESFGIVLIEAMAAGKPVIATTLPGVRRVVEDDVDGFLVPPGDVAALADRLSWLGGDGDRRRAMGMAGRAKVERLYDWPRLAERLETEYAAVLGRPVSSAS